MTRARALVSLPASVRRGESFEVRTLVNHPMETGYRRDAGGALLPRDLVRRFACHYDGELVFAAELHAAVAANPYLAFHVRAVASGTLVFTWEGDNGFRHSESRALNVT